MNHPFFYIVSLVLILSFGSSGIDVARGLTPVLLLFWAAFFIRSLVAKTPEEKEKDKDLAEQAEENRIAQAEAKRIAGLKAAKTRKANKERERKRKDAEAKAEAIEKEKQRQDAEKRKLAQKKFDAVLLKLNNSLPFNTSNKSNEFSNENGDNNRWAEFLKAVRANHTENTKLYLAKIKSLNDDEEYYKIGTTTRDIPDEFLRSTDVELVEVVASHTMKKVLALFAEFHFIREFRPSNNLNKKIEFSESEKVVKSNAIKKIKSLMSRLPEYEAKASGFLGKNLSDNSKQYV